MSLAPLTIIQLVFIPIIAFTCIILIITIIIFGRLCYYFMCHSKYKKTHKVIRSLSILMILSYIVADMLNIAIFYIAFNDELDDMNDYEYGMNLKATILDLRAFEDVEIGGLILNVLSSIFTVIAQVSIYLVLIGRLYLTFQDTIHRAPSWIFCIYGVAMFFIFICWIMSMIYIIFFGRSNPVSDLQTLMISVSFISLIDFFMGISLIYLFGKKLYILILTRKKTSVLFTATPTYIKKAKEKAKAKAKAKANKDENERKTLSKPLLTDVDAIPQVHYNVGKITQISPQLNGIMDNYEETINSFSPRIAAMSLNTNVGNSDRLTVCTNPTITPSSEIQLVSSGNGGRYSIIKSKMEISLIQTNNEESDGNDSDDGIIKPMATEELLGSDDDNDVKDDEKQIKEKMKSHKKMFGKYDIYSDSPLVIMMIRHTLLSSLLIAISEINSWSHALVFGGLYNDSNTNIWYIGWIILVYWNGISQVLIISIVYLGFGFANILYKKICKQCDLCCRDVCECITSKMIIELNNS